MNIDPSTALAITQMLAPYVEKFGEALVAKLGEHTADNIAALWQSIRSKFQGKPDAEKALEEFSKSPADKLAQEKFQKQLILTGESDPSFAQQIVSFKIDNSVINSPTYHNNYVFNLTTPYQPIEPLVSHTIKKKKQTKTKSRKRLIYEQDRFASTFRETGKAWSFWNNQTDSSSIFWIRDGVVGVGGDSSIANQLVIATAQTPAPTSTNVAIDLEIQIDEDYGRPDNWAGIKLRGQTPFQDIGYLVYLRATGSLELYRGRQPYWDGGKLAIAHPQKQWVRIRAECVKNKVRVWVGNRPKPHIEITDNWFGGEGYIFFHTWGVKALYRKLKVYSLD
ncbi:MAG: hypothetical protein HZC38_09265 [Chloroflexi bacterium]|nr:hypothetical protein [Chloroflexota bacterium]